MGVLAALIMDAREGIAMNYNLSRTQLRVAMANQNQLITTCITGRASGVAFFNRQFSKALGAIKRALAPLSFINERSSRFIRIIPLCIGLTALAGCKQVLYKEVSEQEANEMLEVLYCSNINAKKEYITNSTVTLLVDADDFNKAISILKKQGYPKTQYKNVGDVFAESSLIPSSLEERAKYVFAIEQNLSNTISKLDGVLSARVHIVFPERDNKNAMISQATSSVFIKYNPAYDLQGMTPKIKLLVSNAVNDLEYDKVSVTLFPSESINANAGC